MTALPPGKNYRGERTTCLVMYRPNIGITSVAVANETVAIVHIAAWSALLPSLEGVEWWIEPNALPVWAGGSVMDAEQEQAKKERAARGPGR